MYDFFKFFRKPRLNTQLTNAQHLFLESLVDRLATQDNRATQNPLYAVVEDKKVYGSSEWCSEVERREDYDHEYLCDKCSKLIHENDEIPDYCDECDDRCFVWYNIEQQISSQAGVFLSERACQVHIDKNSYHYCNPRVYAISAWRNYEIVTLIDIIFTLTGRKKPNFYD